MTLPRTSTILLIFGATLLIVLISFLTTSPIFEVTLAILAVTCATMTGVPSPRVHTASSAYVMIAAMHSATRSRTNSRTNETTSPMIVTTELRVPASSPAPARASAFSAACLRYASPAAPVHSAVSALTALLYSSTAALTASDTFPHVCP
ncbi:hypothetical protein A8926_2474 [Saccharopolyspora spinosa]|uniref:Uncharacterized protein n=1 Tax=Saccharopolyspora spinosa TaxID=60894 RepID=A0A2N3XVW3_SACSN|nr:hypothetical protein A8926_2474 [Saccharopolyspora spinosa]